MKNAVQIHGTNDLLLKHPKNNATISIEKGGHFMIVDRAGEVSAEINKILKGLAQTLT